MLWRLHGRTDAPRHPHGLRVPEWQPGHLRGLAGLAGQLLRRQRIGEEPVIPLLLPGRQREVELHHPHLPGGVPQPRARHDADADAVPARRRHRLPHEGLWRHALPAHRPLDVQGGGEGDVGSPERALAAGGRGGAEGVAAAGHLWGGRADSRALLPDLPGQGHVLPALDRHRDAHRHHGLPGQLLPLVRPPQRRRRPAEHRRLDVGPDRRPRLVHRLPHILLHRMLPDGRREHSHRQHQGLRRVHARDADAALDAAGQPHGAGAAHGIPHRRRCLLGLHRSRGPGPGPGERRARGEPHRRRVRWQGVCLPRVLHVCVRVDHGGDHRPHGVQRLLRDRDVVLLHLPPVLHDALLGAVLRHPGGSGQRPAVPHGHVRLRYSRHHVPADSQDHRGHVDQELPDVRRQRLHADLRLLRRLLREEPQVRDQGRVHGRGDARQRLLAGHAERVQLHALGVYHRRGPARRNVDLPAHGYGCHLSGRRIHDIPDCYARGGVQQHLQRALHSGPPVPDCDRRHHQLQRRPALHAHLRPRVRHDPVLLRGGGA
mmetsp:Transcript_81334/g.209357  ORF Transcript_81334/g.209357 Transcript_81334/m.209357 type:complete len:544 (-) Transcript_81334:250-1881(-)